MPGSTTSNRPLLSDSLSQAVFPVSDNVRHRVLDEIKHPNVTAEKLAQLIRHDPALALTLFRHVGGLTQGRAGSPQTLDHIISLLGLSRVEQLVTSAPGADTLSPAARARYHREMSISLHAATCAEQWCKTLSLPTPVFWAALLYRAPLWALSQRDDTAFAQWQLQRASRTGSSHQALEEKLFGDTIATLITTACEANSLPTLIHETATKTPRQWLQYGRTLHKTQPNAHDSAILVIQLANYLADAAAWQWTSRHCLRGQQWLARLLRQSLDETVSREHQLSASLIIYWPTSEHPAARLLGDYNHQRLLLAREKSRRKQLTERPAKGPATQSTDANTQTQAEAKADALEAPASLQHLLRQISHAEGADLQHIVHLAATTLCDEAGLERAAVMLLRPHSRRISTLHAAGCERSEPLAKLRCEWQATDVIGALTQKPASLFMQADNRPSVRRKLPAPLRQCWSSESFFLMSIFRDERPAVMLYADRDVTRRPLTGRQYQLFKRVGTALGEGLGRYQGRS